MSGPQVGPLFAFSRAPAATASFYTDIVGLPADATATADATWLRAGNADVVIHAPDDHDTPAEVRAQPGFVVWFGVDDVRAAFERARTAKAVVGDFEGDYFFVRDPEGRYVGIHANEEHGHDHDHEH